MVNEKKYIEDFGNGYRLVAPYCLLPLLWRSEIQIINEMIEDHKKEIGKLESKKNKLKINLSSISGNIL